MTAEISVSDFLETFDLPHSYLDFTSDDILYNPQPPTTASTTTTTSTAAVNHNSNNNTNNNGISESLLGISDLLAHSQLQQVVDEGLGLTRSLAAPTSSSLLPTNLLDGTGVGSSIFNWQPSVESHAFGSISGNSSNRLSTMTVEAVTTGVPVTGWSSGYALQAWLQTSTPQQFFLPDYGLPVMQTMQSLPPQAQSTMRLLESDSSPFLQWSHAPLYQQEGQQQPPMQKLSAPQFLISSQGPNLGYPSLHHRLVPQQSCEYDFYPFQTPNHTLDLLPQQLHQCSIYPFPTGEHKHGLGFPDIGLGLYPSRTRYLATSPPAISVLKRRRRLTNEESEFLLHRFGLNERPTAQERESFAKHLNLDRRTVQVWFQNRRAKLKRDVRGGDDGAYAIAGGSGGSSGSGEEDASETMLMLMLQQQEDVYGAEGKDGESEKVDFEIETETESAKGAAAVACKGASHSRIAQHARFYASSPSPLPPRPQSSSSYTEAAGSRRHVKAKNTDMLYYTASILMGTLGLSYAAVPLYRMFCSATGLGGAPMVGETKFAPERLVPRDSHRRIKVKFNADTSTSLQWSFQPQQREVSVLPGETALAFYTAKNKSKDDVIGIATYNVTPSKVAPHFNKIQCFCFEEQKLMADEQVDMPIFFFLDPEFASDPDMADVDTVVLSYTFFKARGMPFEKQPGISEQHQQQQQQQQQN
ncbi:Cytochrome c oxidase assembly protein cox11, mitochondrial [Dissophora globulifera]|uniref:Cytochrome c oxidase assembly protein cox11, mitochondrial n=1 Tax=Dissophora globulifera TaxID=979702 RepID=A0A9P6UVH7_9FUNG|nr:Cytochrome c oxidase assembly protein cox11, mitochondrial [Dissophora globulifera]